MSRRPRVPPVLRLRFPPVLRSRLVLSTVAQHRSSGSRGAISPTLSPSPAVERLTPVIPLQLLAPPYVFRIRRTLVLLGYIAFLSSNSRVDFRLRFSRYRIEITPSPNAITTKYIESVLLIALKFSRGLDGPDNRCVRMACAPPYQRASCRGGCTTLIV